MAQLSIRFVRINECLSACVCVLKSYVNAETESHHVFLSSHGKRRVSDIEPH